MLARPCLVSIITPNDFLFSLWINSSPLYKVKSKTIEEVAHEIYKVENASSKKESIGVVIENEVADKDHHEKFTEEDEEKVTVGQKTIEEVVNEIAGKPTIWSVLFVIVAMSYGFSVDSLTYLTVFAG